VIWMLVPNTFFVDVWRIWCRIEQLVQLFDLRLKGLTWWATNLSHCYIAQIKTSLWVPLHPMKALLEFQVFQIGFSNQNYPKVIGGQKTSLDKLILTSPVGLGWFFKPTLGWCFWPIPRRCFWLMIKYDIL
jgi:hypothetical protein